MPNATADSKLILLLAAEKFFINGRDVAINAIPAEKIKRKNTVIIFLMLHDKLFPERWRWYKKRKKDEKITGTKIKLKIFVAIAKPSITPQAIPSALQAYFIIRHE